MITSDGTEGQGVYSQFVLLMMAFSCLFILSAQRINMSITMVSMVNWTALEDITEPPCRHNYSQMTKEVGSFKWSYHTQCQILASYLYGLAMANWPAEYLAEAWSAKWLALIGTVIATLCNFLTPVVAKTGEYYLMIIQGLKGVGQALVMPSFGVIVRTWIPSSDLVPFMAYASTAVPIGGFLTVILSGIVMDDVRYGWESIFYICGSLGIIWSLFWCYLSADYFYPTVLFFKSKPKETIPKGSPLPIKRIFKSTSVMALVIAGIATYWAYSFNILLLPTYMRRAQKIDLQWNCVVSSIPNLLQSLMFLAAIMSSESILKNRISEKDFVRKFCMVSGFAVFLASSVLLTFSECNKLVSSFLTTIGLGFIGLNLATLFFLPLDMSPKYSSFLSGLVNTVGPLAGSTLPFMVGLLSVSEEGIGNWNRVFYASILLSCFGMILFLAFGSGKVQPWDDSFDAGSHPEPEHTEREQSLSDANMNANGFTENGEKNAILRSS